MASRPRIFSASPEAVRVDTADSVSHPMSVRSHKSVVQRPRGLGRPHIYRGIVLSSTLHTSHQLRLTIRFAVSDPTGELAPSHIDVWMPAMTSLAEALPEFVDLGQAPALSVPWIARTAAGTEIDQSLPLSHTGLTHGDIIVFSPFEDTAVTVRKDSAEALHDLPISFDARGLAAVITGIGLLSLSMLIARSSLPTIDSWTLYLLLAISAMALTMWVKVASPAERAAHALLSVGSTMLVAAAVWLAIIGQTAPTTLSQRGWAGIAALVTAACVFAFLGWASSQSLSILAGGFSSILLCLVAALGFLTVEMPSQSAALVILAGLVLMLCAPGASALLAGLSVPVLPAAGQDLKISDHDVADADQRAARAVKLLDGISLGSGTIAGGALLFLGFTAQQPGFCTATCLAVAAATALHATRHRSAPAMWGQWLWTASGLLGATLAGLQSGVGGVLVTLVAGFVAISAPLWAARIRRLSPPVFNWLEKLEALALAASFPLAAHLAGVFDAIRGLG